MYPVGVPPQNMIISFMSVSKVMSQWPRGAGEVAGCSLIQVLPFQIQVPLKCVLFWAIPPNSSNWLVAGSQAMAAPLLAGGELAGCCWVQDPFQVQVSP